MSKIPAVLDELVALARFLLPDEVTVYDGPPDVDPEHLPDKFLCIGFDPAGERAVTTEIVAAGLGKGDVREQSSIACGISFGIGETTIKKVRDEVDALYETFRSGVAANPTLSGLVLRAMCSFVGLDQAQTETGAVVDLFFAVDVLAFES